MLTNNSVLLKIMYIVGKVNYWQAVEKGSSTDGRKILEK